MISMQLFLFQHCYFALYSYHELKQNGDMEGIIYKVGIIFIYYLHVLLS